MAGSLVLVDEYTVSGTPAAITIGGGSSGSSSYNYAMDTTYNVYMLVITGLTVSADDAPLMRVTKSGTSQEDANYDEAKEYLKADTTFSTIAAAGQTKIDCMATIDSGISAGGGNGTYYLFNFPNASEYSFVTIEGAHFQASDDTVRGFQGGFVHTVASASDGLRIGVNNWTSGSTLTGGNFKLFGIGK
jgi:hypothetical protein